MSDFRLQPGIKVEYDKENEVFKFLNHYIDKHKKLTSRAFPNILGENRWESIGKTILERYKMIQKDQIDKYYTVRGELAEMIVKDYLKGFYKEKLKVDLELVTWDKFKISFDNFPKNPKFGGMLDIAIKSPEKFRAVVEVKSKSLKDLEKITASKGNTEEVRQGLFLSYLSLVDKCLMVYVFFTPQQEQTIKEYIANQKAIGYKVDEKIFSKEIIKNNKWTYKNFTIKPFRYSVGDYKMKEDTEKAYGILTKFKTAESIGARYFSDTEQGYLKNLAGVVEEETSLF